MKLKDGYVLRDIIIVIVIIIWPLSSYTNDIIAIVTNSIYL